MVKNDQNSPNGPKGPKKQNVLLWITIFSVCISVNMKEIFFLCIDILAGKKSSPITVSLKLA